jgi:hypothetical protein
MKLTIKAVMKRMVQSIAVLMALMMVTSVTTFAQTTQSEKEKQKEMELKQKEMELKQKQEQEQLQKDLQEAEELMIRAEEQKAQEYERIARDYEGMRKRAEGMSKNAVVVIPEEGTWNIRTPHIEDFYFYNSSSYDSPGSSWNYSRQVLEATFSNEFTMSAGDESSISLSVSGNCAEGSISVAIVMPDGKQLSEVMIDENGSLNWRKSFEADEETNWKNGKWVFRIKAKDATGNFRIAMTSN